MALNNKYVELMDYLGCPWIQSVLPASLACQDIAYWVDQVRNSMPLMNMSGRLRELAGLPTEEDYEACRARGERIDGRLIVEPMDLKRRLMSMDEGDEETMSVPSSHSTVSTAFRMVQMSIIMGFKVSGINFFYRLQISDLPVFRSLSFSRKSSGPKNRVSSSFTLLIVINFNPEFHCRLSDERIPGLV